MLAEKLEDIREDLAELEDARGTITGFAKQLAGSFDTIDTLYSIGREMHEWPFLANEGKPGKGPRLQEGSVLAVEPMLVLGGETGTRTLSDEWTVVTIDGSPASHWEHTVAVTADGPRILTPRPGVA